MRTVGQTQPRGKPPVRVAVVAGEATARQFLVERLQTSPALDVVAWADSLNPLVVLGTRVDVCLCCDPQPGDEAARLAARGSVVAVQDGDPVTAVLSAAA